MKADSKVYVWQTNFIHQYELENLPVGTLLTSHPHTFSENIHKDQYQFVVRVDLLTLHLAHIQWHHTNEKKKYWILLRKMGELY